MNVVARTDLDLPQTPSGDFWNPGNLLDRLSETLTRHLVLPPGAADAMALWIFNAHCHDHGRISPMLALVSPDRRCGKTTALNLIKGLVPRPVETSNITQAAMYRLIEAESPTLLIDEADTFLKQKGEFVGILNAGHARDNAYVIRANDRAPGGYRSYNVWCAKVLAMIGSLPLTLADRSIVVRLFRKSPDERIERLRLDPDDEILRLNEALAEWAAANSHLIRDSEPVVPIGLHDRAADNWRQLLAIADLAGEDWALRGRSAAIALSGHESDEASGDLLFGDIKQIFSMSGADGLPTQKMLSELNDMEHRPWPAWANGRPMTPIHLARVLSAYGIRPVTQRFAGKLAKGYLLGQFTDAFKRYT
jgi:hypothetical protein